MKILVIFDVEHWKWIAHFDLDGYEWATVLRDEQGGNYLFEEIELYFHTALLAMMRAGEYL